MSYEFIGLIGGNILVCWKTIFEFGIGEVDTLDLILLTEYNGPGSMDGGLLDCWTGIWGGLWNRITGEEIIFCVFITTGGFIISFYVIGTGGWWKEKVLVIWGDRLLFKLLGCFEFCKFYIIFLVYPI